MFSEKLLSALLAFSKVELNRFRRYLSSTYLNEQPELTRLFDACDTAIRTGEEAVQQLDKTAAWQAVFPGKKYDDATLRRLASDLTQMVYRFRVAEEKPLGSLPSLFEIQRVLEKTALEKHLVGVDRSIQKTLDEQPTRPLQFYRDHYRLHWAIFNRSAKTIATADYLKKLAPADQYLDCFYLIQKLKFYTAWLVYRGFRSAEEEFVLPPGFWEYVRSERFSDVPLISIYILVVNCLENPDDEPRFEALLAALEKHAAVLADEDLREFYHIAQNYAAIKINQGKSEYYRTVFELFKTLIERDILLSDNQLQEGVFKNIITVSLRLGEFEWAERFIHEHAEFLPQRIRENARSFNLATVYFYQKQYGKVVELLQSVEYSDVTYALGSKLLLTMTYYETRELHLLDSLMDSFRIFLRRNQVLSKTLKREYLTFLNFVGKLVGIAPRTALALRAKIMETPSVASKKWLLEKVEEAQKRSK